MVKHFLIIDDDEDELKMLVEALDGISIDHKCTWARNGEQALKQLEFITPDLIFLDYRMTGIDGLQCLEAIKKLDNCQSVPVIFHSTQMNPVIRTKALQLGAIACFKKAGSFSEMKAGLENLLIKNSKIQFSPYV